MALFTNKLERLMERRSCEPTPSRRVKIAKQDVMRDIKNKLLDIDIEKDLYKIADVKRLINMCKDKTVVISCNACSFRYDSIEQFIFTLKHIYTFLYDVFTGLYLNSTKKRFAKVMTFEEFTKSKFASNLILKEEERIDCKFTYSNLDIAFWTYCFQDAFREIFELINKIYDFLIQADYELFKSDIKIKSEYGLYYAFFNKFVELTVQNLKHHRNSIYDFLIDLNPTESNYNEILSSEAQNNTVIEYTSDFNDKSLETLFFAKSLEAVEKGAIGANFNPENPSEGVLSKVFNAIKGLPIAINGLNKKIKLFRTKSKNYRFYKKFLGRIDHMYERYGDEASITENKMNGDPVEILKDSAKVYIERISQDLADLYKELADLSRRCAKMNNAKQALAEINNFLGDDKMDFERAKRLPKTMVRATKKRIARSILTDNNVYGYTVDSIVEKSFPPANHAIVSLFVENAQEKPEEQKVTDIIKDIKSFKLIAANEKQPVFDIAKMCNNLLVKGIQHADLKELKKNKTMGLKMLKSGVIASAKNMDKDEKKAQKRLYKQTKYIWKGLEKSLAYVASMKSYTFDLINGYFTMMIRIDNLCKQCVVSMLDVERMKKDERHDTGFKGSKLGKYRKYRQNDDEYRTKGERELEKINEVQEARRERAEKTKDLKNRIKAYRYSGSDWRRGRN